MNLRAVRYNSPFGETLEQLLGLDHRHAGTRLHSRRAHCYALELARAVDPGVLDDDSVEYGFVFHDIGEIGIPDSILLEPAALTKAERQVMQTQHAAGRADARQGETASRRRAHDRAVTP